MTNRGALALAERLPRPTEELHDDWVLSVSLHEPGRVQPDCLPWAERGSVRGFFHGLLFERESLAATTNSRSDCPDAELVLRVYEHGGEVALSRLRGSFVIAIIDRTRGLAIVARDPLGSHPLFYAEAGSCVLFAAASRPLLNSLGVSRALNRDALADHLCSRWPDPHETFFSAVRRVPAGRRAIVSAGHLSLERYWDPMPDDRPVQWLTAEETARFDEVFNQAVDRCLHNGPTGIFLSGGLDSISVAAVAADRARRIGHNPPLALSLGFTDPSCDERVRQAAVARELGLRQYLLDPHEAVGPRPLLEQALELNQEIDAPLLHTYKPSFLALARRARLNGVQTVLTGQGGDEWLAVTPLLAADLLRRGAILELAHFFGALLRSYEVSPLALARNLLWTCGLRPLAGSAFHRLMPEANKSRRLERLLAGDPIWVTPDPELRAEQRRRAECMLAAPEPRQGFYVRELRAGIDHTLIAWDAEEQYALGRRIGVQFLHPFWDPDVVEMLGRIPPRLLNEGGRTKGLIRQTLARRFPELRLERQRKVQATPVFLSLLLREGLALAEAVGDFPALSALGIVDGRATGAFVRAHITQPSLKSYRAWQPINLEMWVRSHGGH